MQHIKNVIMYTYTSTCTCILYKKIITAKICLYMVSCINIVKIL